MRTETRNLYTLEELSPEARQRAIDANRDWNTDYGWWGYTIDDFTQCAAALGFTVDAKKVYFSGFSSQGDGACFSGRYTFNPGWRAELERYCPAESELFSIGAVLEGLSPAVTDASVTTSGRYSHEGTMSAECWDADGEESGSENAAGFLEVARDLARWLYRRLELEHEYLTSDDAVAESLTVNGIEFLESGDEP